MKYSLTELAKFKSGTQINIKREKGSIPIYGSNGVVGYTNKYNAENNIIIGRVGANCGSVQFFTDKFWATDNTLVVYEDSGKIDKHYLYYLLKYLDLNRFSGGSAQPLITQRILSQICIEIPTLEEQKKYVEKLKTLDFKININKEIIKTITKKLQTIYSYWFHQFEFLDSNGRPYKSSGGEMVWNKKLNMEIPVNWNTMNLGEMFIYENGTEPSEKKYIENPKDINGLLKFYRVADVDKESKIFVNENEFSKNCNYGDVLVSFDGAIGKITYYFDGVFSTGFKNIKSKKYSNLIPFLIFSDKHIIKKLDLSSSSGSILKHAFSYISYIEIPYSKEIYELFDNKFKDYFFLMVEVSKENIMIEEYKTFLMQFILTGFPVK